MLVIAHRGASGLEPENTIRSFKKAQELGVDMIELDVRQSSDGELVVIHDSHLKRIFDIDKAVGQTTVSELKQISSNAGREIPTLAEVLKEISIPLDLDIKVHGIESKLLDTVKNFPANVLISSIYPGVLKKIRALDKKIQLGLIVGRGELHLLPVINPLIEKLDLYSIHPKYMLVYKASMAILKMSKRKIFPWTVNEPHEFDRVNKLNLDGIITDQPQLFVKNNESR